MNLLPPLSVFSYHQWSWASKVCFHCKRLISTILERGQIFACSPSFFFFPEDTLFPRSLWRWMSWGWNCSTAHLCASWGLPVQHFGHKMVICPSGWRAAISTCICVCRFLTKTLTDHLRSCAVNWRIPPWNPLLWISNSVLVSWWVFLCLGCITYLKSASD